MSNEKDKEAPRFIPNMHSLKFKETENTKAGKEENKEKPDSTSEVNPYNTTSNPDQHGTSPDREEETEQTPGGNEQTGKPNPEKEGQQEEHTPMPKTPPSEWEIKDEEGNTKLRSNDQDGKIGENPEKQNITDTNQVQKHSGL